MRVKEITPVAATTNLPPGVSRRKIRLFGTLAILLPLLLLLLAEGLLRAVGYGHDTGLFVKDPDDGAYYVMNPYASSLYFSDSVNATKGNIERFPVQKAPGTLRIFVLGESTTAGYPYMHNGSFHRWLLYRLLHDFPDKKIEMINVSLTAVNSYTVLGFGKQIPDYEPDAVLIYTGHNEYYGALGIGSTSRIGGNRSVVKAILWLRRFRLVQWMEQCIHFFGSLFSGKTTDTRENLMQRMAEKQTIPVGSKDFYAGVNQFRENMDALCRVMSDRKIPLFLSTLVSNEKDQPPFISATGNDPSTAGHQFRLGDSAYRAGDYTLAKRAYVQASESDLLRFRAPDTLNGIIRQLCREYRGNTHLVDARSLFESHSPHGILGKETFLEHVHPNLYGYALLSDAFYRSMKTAGLFSSLPAGSSTASDSAGSAPGNSVNQHPGFALSGEMPFDSLLQRMPVTRVDSLNGAYQIMMLKTRWPFHEPIPAGFVRGNSPEEQLAGALAVGRINWLDAMDQLFKVRMRSGDKKGALQVAEATMLENPENKTYLTFCGRLSFEAGYWPDAIMYFKRLYRQDSSTANALNLLLAYIKTDEPQQALGLLNERPELNSTRRRQQHWIDLLEEIISLKKLPGAASRGSAINRQVARDYIILDAPEAAARYETLSGARR
jgi:tetratricopeptide (TPR) repeat protein